MNSLNKSEYLNVRSDEVQEVMGNVPHWILRWGISLVAVVCLLLIAGSCFFRYPEKISTEIHLKTSPPAVYISSSFSGTLRDIYVENGDIVNEGQVLATLNCHLNTNESIIASPINGIVNFISDYSIGCNVSEGSPLFGIVPLDAIYFMGTMYVDSSEIGKIAKGQQVIVRFYSESSADLMKGDVKSISYCPNKDGKYLVEVNFPINMAMRQAGFCPTRLPTIGQAEIIVRDKRLIENLLQPLERLFN